MTLARKVVNSSISEARATCPMEEEPVLGLTAVPTSEQQLQQKLLASVLKRPYVQINYYIFFPPLKFKPKLSEVYFIPSIKVKLKTLNFRPYGTSNRRAPIGESSDEMKKMNASTSPARPARPNGLSLRLALGSAEIALAR